MRIHIYCLLINIFKTDQIKFEEQHQLGNNQSNELANLSSSNILDMFSQILYNKNSLPSMPPMEDKKLGNEANLNALALLKVTKSFLAQSLFY